MKNSILESTCNTRVLPTGDGRYLRSDCPVHLTDDEVAWLRGQGITTIVDLRGLHECERHPCRLEDEPGFTYHHMPVTGGSAIPDTREEMTAIYQGMLDERMDEIIDTIMNAPGRVMYFCAAGKDRTGVVSAIILQKYGVDEETIVDDYMQTKENVKEMLEGYAGRHPEVNLDALIPRAENIRMILAGTASK